MTKDQAGNLILLGFVESDSTFSDLTVQKISPEGNLFWEYRFDSKNQKDYDVPVKMALDASGNIFVLGKSNGLSSYFQYQQSNGFLFKLSNTGDLMWQIGFDTLSLLPQHDSGLHCDGYLDTMGNFLVSYSTHREFGTRPTYFIKFSTEGTVLQSFLQYHIAQSFGGGPSASGQAIDSIGNFVFLQFDETQYPKHSIRKVNPETGISQNKILNLDGLPVSDSIDYIYLDFLKIWTDDYNEIYTANNHDAPFGPTFYLSKVRPDGFVKYIFHPQDSVAVRFSSLKPWRGFAYTTGSYIPKNSSIRVAFLWKINDSGEIEAQTTTLLPHNCVPRFLDILDGKIYWVVQDVVSGDAVLKELEATDLTSNWTYPLQQSPDYLFTGSNFIRLPNNKAAIAGTLRKEKQPGSGYLSEEDFYVEAFTPVSNEFYSQYQKSERGTSLVESIAHSTDPFGNILVKTTEVDGPEYFTVQYAPRKYYYLKYDSLGSLLWIKQRDRQAFSQYGTDAFYFDQQGNAYTLEYGQDSLSLLKISPTGEFLNAFSTNFIHLFIDNQDRLHLTYGNFDGQPETILLNNNFQIIQPVCANLWPIKMFQLPSDNSVYYYMEDRADWNEQQVRILFFKDGIVLWERVYDFSSPEYQSFAKFDLNPETGGLVATSIWRNSAGFFETALHRFTMDNQYSTQVIPTPLDEFPAEVANLLNGNIYLTFSQSLELYDSTFQLLKSVPISNTPGGGYFFRSGNVFFRAHNGTLDAYNSEGFPLPRLTHASFTFDPHQISINNSNQLTTTDIFGNWIGGGYDFGWRWYRGRVQTFDFSNWVSTSSTETTEAPVNLNYWPNPIEQTLNIDISDFEANELQISLISSTGQTVYFQKIDQIKASSPVQLNLPLLANGLYYLQTQAVGHYFNPQKIVVINP